jgi:hypothetical protein
MKKLLLAFLFVSLAGWYVISTYKRQKAEQAFITKDDFKLFDYTYHFFHRVSECEHMSKYVECTKECHEKYCDATVSRLNEHILAGKVKTSLQKVKRISDFYKKYHNPSETLRKLQKKYPEKKLDDFFH